MERDIGEFEKNSVSKIKVALKNYKGHDFIDIRTFYEDEASGEWHPTKKGIAISPAKVGELVRLLNIASKNGENSGE